MSPVRSFSRKDFYREYQFPRQHARDFELDGRPAEFASCHPMEWSDLAEAIDFNQEMKGADEKTYVSCETALSSDQKLLAISTSYDHILIYDVTSKELRAVLEGGGGVVFRPTQGAEESGYTLVSSVSYNGSRGALPKNQLIIWDLDQQGRLVDEEEPIDAAAFANKAIDAILPELISEHEWTKDFVQASNLHAEVTKALSAVAADHRRRHHTILDDAKLGHFGSVSFSKDGRLLLYHYQDKTTQHGMREPDLLPRVVLYDIEAGKILHYLTGHTDAIMWSAISPDNENVASISWDGTMRMYSLSTGELAWATEDSGGQSWAGAFSPDSKHIVWSSASGKTVQVHAVASGQKVSTFGEKFTSWCRSFAWHPSGHQVALCVGKHAYVWQPFDGPDGTVVQHFELSDFGDTIYHRMEAVSDISWMYDGRLIALKISDGSKVAYDTQTNLKEVFARPKGVEGFSVGSGFYGVLKDSDENQADFYLSVDGDGKVRYWRCSVNTAPSWWEKGVEEDASAQKKVFPETGKYVKITKTLSKAADQQDEGRASWADKGGELWTAE